MTHQNYAMLKNYAELNNDSVKKSNGNQSQNLSLYCTGISYSYSYWLMMTASTKMMRTICKKTTSSAFSGLDFKRNMMILNGLFGLLRLKRAAVSGLDL